MQTIIAITVCGAIGCLSRYWISGLLYSLFGRAFPIGTFVVNILGAFCIGLVMEFSLRSTLIPPTLRIGITIGFLGGLTTFSSFSYETFRLLEEGNFLIATTNIVLNVLICLTFTWGGIMAARYL